MRAFDWKALDTPNFRQRVLSSLIIAPPALLAVHWGGWIYMLAVALVMTLGMREWLRLLDANMNREVMIASYAALWIVLVATFIVSGFFGLVLLVLATAGLFYFARQKNISPNWLAGSMPYIAGAGLTLLCLRDTPAEGGLIYYLLAVVWSTDVGAYLAGRLIGGPKLAPAISPNKTWAGLLGGMLLATIFGYVAGACLGARQTVLAAGLAIVLSLVAQGGDFFESFFKRKMGAKESGDLIPGHGGVLDRIDGLVFAAVFFALFQAFYGTDAQWW